MKLLWDPSLKLESLWADATDAHGQQRNISLRSHFIGHPSGSLVHHRGCAAGWPLGLVPRKCFSDGDECCDGLHTKGAPSVKKGLRLSLCTRVNSGIRRLLDLR